jgi:hypothetical protein
VLRLSKRQVDELLGGDRASLAPVLLSRTDGMRGTECNSGHPAGVRRRDGTYCFATTNGVAVSIRSGCARSKTRRRSASRTCWSMAPRSPGPSRRQPSRRLIAPLEVPSGARRLEIRYAGIALTAPERVAFRYRLEGFDRAWVDAGRARLAQFTGLPPGRYRFAVEARRGSGRWSQRSESVLLDVRPAFHQTRAFFALVVASGRRRRGGAADPAAAGTRTSAADAGRPAHAGFARGLPASRAHSRARARQPRAERLSLLDGLTRVANRRQLDAARRRVAACRPPRRRSRWCSATSISSSRTTTPTTPRRRRLPACGRRALAACVQRADDLVARYGGGVRRSPARRRGKWPSGWPSAATRHRIDEGPQGVGGGRAT